MTTDPYRYPQGYHPGIRKTGSPVLVPATTVCRRMSGKTADAGVGRHEGALMEAARAARRVLTQSLEESGL
ncbi:MAG: hypothetical protein QOC63_5862 [Mycobacterium sp.]|jgi:hypothetical protein|nr:hypothetical protein [Mycobacterium sp.]